MVTPQVIENRLTALSKEVDSAQDWLEEAEKEYHTAKTEYELGMARARMSFSSAGKLRVQDVQDAALLQNAAGAFASLVLIASSITTEHICRLPDDPDSGDQAVST